ncbi:hypothetical protein T484DRAFT_2711157 [Baffinella frigidus]|nr:hypothetical protein T484DRAFT_2711157 [Cryptophyta sp. CCMP2293]
MRIQEGLKEPFVHPLLEMRSSDVEMASRPFKAAAERDGATDTSSEQDLGSLRELEVDDVIEAIGGFGLNPQPQPLNPKP